MEKNVTKAKILLEKAVAKNSSFAYNVLGFIEIHYNHNATAAMHYWKKGMKYGDVQSTFNYASMMEQTNHVRIYETMFRRYGSVLFLLFRNKMKPFYWLIVAVTSILTNRTTSFRFGTEWNRNVMCEHGLILLKLHLPILTSQGDWVRATELYKPWRKFLNFGQPKSLIGVF